MLHRDVALIERRGGKNLLIVQANHQLFIKFLQLYFKFCK